MVFVLWTLLNQTDHWKLHDCNLNAVRLVFLAILQRSCRSHEKTKLEFLWWFYLFRDAHILTITPFLYTQADTALWLYGHEVGGTSNSSCLAGVEYNRYFNYFLNKKLYTLLTFYLTVRDMFLCSAIYDKNCSVGGLLHQWGLNKKKIVEQNYFRALKDSSKN